MQTPDDRKYTKEHEWVQMEADGTARIGISFFAQDHLGDVVYVDLPAAGTRIEQFKQMGEVESVKAVSELYSPVTGQVVEVNRVVVESPELMNTDPYTKGWLVRVQVDNPRELENLLNAGQYDRLTAVH